MGELIQLNNFRKNDKNNNTEQTTQSTQSQSQVNTTQKINSQPDELYLKGDEFIFNKSLNQDLFEIFTFNCDPKLRQWESSHNGLKDILEIQQVFPKDLEDTIKQLQTSKFNFGEPISGHEYSQSIIVEETEITNHLIEQYGLSISKVTQLGYTRFFELFCDRYNGTNNLDSEFQLFSKQEIKYGLMRSSDSYAQDTLKTIQEFPEINQNNLENFLQFWGDLRFNDKINIY